MAPSMRMAVLGCGAMAKALAIPMKEADDTLDIYTYTPTKIKARELADQIRGHLLEDIRHLNSFDLILLGFKPQHLPIVAKTVGTCTLRKSQTIVSLLAGTPLSILENTFKTPSIIRLMPNLPFAVGQGIGLVFSSEGVFRQHESYLLQNWRKSAQLFQTSKEEDLDYFTPISGSGPAFIFELAQLMAKNLEQYGMGQEEAHRLVVQLLLGSAKLAANSPKSFEELREMVTSQKGITHAALTELKDSGWHKIMAQALEHARQRTHDLSKIAQGSSS